MQSYIVFDSIICMIDRGSDRSGHADVHGIKFVDAEQGMSLALAAFVYQKIVGEIH
ncbi:MAG: hypothetical protein IPP59_05575 [Betaproteobacteria bacterium]|nr:hypothetical protein [Candidatus Dechloromonas phosphorivorans]